MCYIPKPQCYAQVKIFGGTPMSPCLNSGGTFQISEGPTKTERLNSYFCKLVYYMLSSCFIWCKIFCLLRISRSWVLAKSQMAFARYFQFLYIFGYWIPSHKWLFVTNFSGNFYLFFLLLLSNSIHGPSSVEMDCASSLKQISFSCKFSFYHQRDAIVF